MNIFNREDRKNNAIKSSAFGAAANIIKIVLAFVYRTLFLAFLSKEYLGVNGLFSNILQILSLAELGVTTAITFRFYQPISDNDVRKVGMLMNYFKKVYLVIAAIIMGAGMAILPFVKFLIKDTSEIPSDINIYFIYFLFLANTVSSYIFVYKLTLLSADQKGYKLSLINIVTTFIQYLAQILTLVISKNYTFTLLFGIVATLITNFIFSELVKRKYRPVFEEKEMLSKEERKQIMKDTRATMYHKIGTVVLTGTDSAILSKMVSLAATGLYSNYSMIIMNIQNVLGQLLGNFVSSLGNARINMDSEQYYRLYKRVNFIGLWISTVSTVCLYIVIDDFIYVWLGENYLFDQTTTVFLCLQFFIGVSRSVNSSFTNASGLFVKDRIRPLIEAAINLVVSIILAKQLGIMGVFIGTVVSSVATVCWREPYILFKYDFQRSVSEYWKNYFSFVGILGCFCVVMRLFKRYVLRLNMNIWIVLIEAAIVFMCINTVLVLIFRKKEEYAYLVDLLKEIKKKLLRR